MNGKFSIFSFEEYLIEKHAKQYVGTDDNMPDDYNDWKGGLDIDDVIEWANQWRAIEVQEAVREFVDGLVDQLKTGTIVDQRNDETGEIAEATDTTLVSAVLHHTAVEIIQLYFEDYLTDKKEVHGN